MHVDMMVCRLFNTFSGHKARCIPWTVWERNQPVQVHVCTRSPASDTGDHRLHWS